MLFELKLLAVRVNIKCLKVKYLKEVGHLLKPVSHTQSTLDGHLLLVMLKDLNIYILIQTFFLAGSPLPNCDYNAIKMADLCAK